MPSLKDIPSLSKAVTMPKGSLAVGSNAGNSFKSAPAPAPAPKPSFFQRLVDFGAKSSDIANNIASSVAQPFTKVVGTGVRALQSIPSLARGDTQGALAIQKKPIFGQPTLPGSTIPQNLGTAAEAASFLVPETRLGAVGGGAVAGGLAGSGSALQDPNASAGKVLAEGAGGAVVGAGIGGLIEGAQRLATAPKVSNAAQVAEDAIKNPLTPKEQQVAVGQGRAAVGGLNKEISYEPDVRTQNMQKAIAPLAEDGRIVAPTTPEAQLSNITNTQEEITKQGQQLKDALKTSTAVKGWNSNELKGRLASLELPNVVKSETALTKQANTFMQGVLDLAADTPKDPLGLLELRQETDDLINQDFGQNFFDQDKNATALRQYIYSVRDELNDYAASRLPGGNLPDGTSYEDALKTQHNLINAKDQMAEKFTREYPEGSTSPSRFLKAHPLIRRFGLRAALSIGTTLAGVSLLNSSVRKGVAAAVKTVTGQ